MPTEHDDFVGFVSATNLCDGVVGSRTFGIDTIDDIELQHHVSAVIENTADTPEVFIAHDDRWYHFVDVEGPVVESTNLPKLTTRIVNTNQSAVRFQKHI